MPLFYNRPIATLVKWYVDKRSGHVQDARSEIQRRFAYLDWSQQKKITLAFLSSGKTDRQWIYAQLWKWWDDCFAPKIREIWEQYHEEKCAWLIIRYFPKDYVLANLDYFTGTRDYYYICRRFGAGNDFVIDDSKLSARDRFIIHAISQKPLDGDSCLDDIFTCLHGTCATEYSYPLVNKKDRGEILDALDIKYIYGMMKNMERMGLDEQVQFFREWNRQVYVDIFHSADWEQLNASNLSDGEYDIRRRYIMKKYVYKNLDDKYKKVNERLDALDFGNIPDDFTTYEEKGTDKMSSEATSETTKEQMRELIERNPAFETIIDDLGLITDDQEEVPF
ncbi:MAG: hypothetical protein J5637_08550 [Prevotella sp.]|nr:hypothetical protein [Prevotella sp.]